MITAIECSEVVSHFCLIVRGVKFLALGVDDSQDQFVAGRGDVYNSLYTLTNILNEACRATPQL